MFIWGITLWASYASGSTIWYKKKSNQVIFEQQVYEIQNILKRGSEIYWPLDKRGSSLSFPEALWNQMEKKYHKSIIINSLKWIATML